MNQKLKNSVFSIILIVLVVLLLADFLPKLVEEVEAAQSQVGVYYISPGGSDTNAGTITGPWRTFERAFDSTKANYVKGGDTLYFRAGTYRLESDTDMYTFATGGWNISMGNLSGTESKPTVIAGYGNEKAKIYLSENVTGWKLYTPLAVASAYIPKSTTRGAHLVFGTVVGKRYVIESAPFGTPTNSPEWTRIVQFDGGNNIDYYFPTQPNPVPDYRVRSTEFNKKVYTFDWNIYITSKYPTQYANLLKYYNQNSAYFKYKDYGYSPQLVAVDGATPVLLQQVNSEKTAVCANMNCATWNLMPTSVRTGLSDMRAGDFYYETDKNSVNFGKLFVWLPDGSDPKEKSIEVGLAKSLIFQADWLTLKNLTFRYSGASIKGFWEGVLGVSGSNNTIDGLDVSYNDYGALGGWCKNCTIKNSKFSYNGNVGSTLAGNNTVYENNIINGNNYRIYDAGSSCGGVKFFPNDLNDKDQSMIFRRNTLEGNIKCPAVWFDTEGAGHQILNNQIKDNDDYGVMVEVSKGTAVSPIIVEDNIFENNGIGTGWQSGVYVSASDYVQVKNNIFKNQPGGVFAHGLNLSDPLRKSVSNNSITNNIFINVALPITIPVTSNIAYRRFSTTPDGDWQKNLQVSAVNNISDYNTFFGTSPTPIWSDNGKTGGLLADLNSKYFLSVDYPGYVDSNGDGLNDYGISEQLPRWQSLYGLDLHSRVATSEADALRGVTVVVPDAHAPWAINMIGNSQSGDLNGANYFGNNRIASGMKYNFSNKQTAVNNVDQNGNLITELAGNVTLGAAQKTTLNLLPPTMPVFVPLTPSKEIWIDDRNDGIAGTGTQKDPFDGSTQQKFDAIMHGLIFPTVQENVAVHLMAGNFETRGNDGWIPYSRFPTQGWHAWTGWRIMGSGMETTTLKLSSTADNWGGGIGVISGGWNNTHHMTVSDLTVDCNKQNFANADLSIGAVGLKGHDNRIERVKATNCGGGTNEGFTLTVGSDDASDSVGNVIADSIVENMQGGWQTAINMFHSNGGANYHVSGVVSGNKVYGDTVNGDSLSSRVAFGGWGMGNVIFYNNLANGTGSGFIDDSAKSDGFAVRNNKFLNLRGYGLNIGGGGVYDNLKITDNQITLKPDAQGFFFNGKVSKAIVERNVVDLSEATTRIPFPGEVVVPSATITLSLNSNTATVGDKVNIIWNATNAVSCTASGGWGGTKSPKGGTEQSAVLTTDTTFTLVCVNQAGTSGMVQTSVAVSRQPKPLTCGSVGDLNNDKQISDIDGEIIRNYILTTKGLNDAQKKDADLNNDGVITTLDINVLNTYLNSSISAFPKCALSKPLACGVPGTVSALGDVNGDGRISEFDAETIQLSVLGLAPLSADGNKIADVNADGTVSTLDVLKINSYVKGLIPTLEGCIPDLAAPVRTLVSPLGPVPAGTTNVILAVATNEVATCKYDTVPGRTYSQMSATLSDSGDKKEHGIMLSNIPLAVSAYYVRCQDASVIPNTNLDDFVIEMTVLPNFGFTLGNDGNRSVIKGTVNTVTNPITVTKNNSVATQSVSFSVSGLPQNATHQLASCTPDLTTLSCASLLTITLPNTVVPANYPIEITASASGMTSVKTNFNLTVTEPIPVQTTVSISDFSPNHTYNGQNKVVSVTTNPAGKSYDVTYNPAIPMSAGTYTVTANITDPGFIGSATRQLVIEKANQAVTLDAILNKKTTDTFSLTDLADSTSGLPVSFSVVSGNANIANGVISFTGTGDVTVRAGQSGDDNYNSAPGVEMSFKVEKKLANLTLTNLSQTYSPGVVREASYTTADPISLQNVSFEYHKVNYVIELIKLFPTIDPNPVSPVEAGEYEVVATVNHPDYEGTFTDRLVIAKANQTITFDQDLAGKQVGDTIDLSSAVSSSGLPIAFEVEDGDAALNGDELSLNGAGEVTVVASQSGDDNFEGATSVTRTFNVGKAPVVVVINEGEDSVQTYGNNTKSVSVRTVPVGKNVVVAYNPVNPKNAGEYTVTATLDDDNFEGSATGRLIIQKSPQTLTFTPDLTGKEVGDTVTLSAVSTSGLPVTFTVSGAEFDSQTKVVTLNTSGNVTITASQAGNDNYEAATAVVKNFAVGKAPITLAFTSGDLQQTYGATRAVTTNARTGLSVRTTYDGSEVLPTNAGTYRVIATIDDHDYSGSVEGDLVIAKADQTITFADIDDKNVNDSFTLSAGNSSPLTVRFRLAEGSPATLAGDLLTLTGEGEVTVTAYQAGNSNYKEARDVAVSFNVRKNSAPISFVAEDLQQTFNNSARAVRVTINNGANIPANHITITYKQGNTVLASAPTNAGTYSVSATVDDPIFTGSIVETPFFIDQAPQTLTWNQTFTGKQVGDTLTLSAVSTSGLPVTFTVSGAEFDSQTKVVTLNTSGNVTITASQQGNDNYEAATSIVRNFAVGKAPITLAFTSGDLQQTYGTTRAVTTNARTGLSVRTTYDGSEVLPTNAGTYRVIATIDDHDYSGSVEGDLVVAKADQTITFADIDDKNVNDVFTLSGNSTSNLPVTFRLGASSPVTLDGNELELTGAGHVTLIASQVGSVNYRAATEVTVEFEVGRQTAFISLTGTRQTYNGGDHRVTVVTNPANLGAMITYDGQATPPSNVGTYAVKVVVDSLAYSGEVEDILIIEKAEQVINFEQVFSNQKVGDTVTLSAVSTAGLPVTFTVSGAEFDSQTKVVTLNTSGNVTITASQAGNDNYEAATAVVKNFAVGKGRADIELNQAELIQTYNGDSKSVGYTTSRTVQNVEVTYRKTQRRFLGLWVSADEFTTTPTDVGVYEVVATVVDQNFTGEVSGELRINPAELAIDFTVPTEELNQFVNNSIVLSATSPSSEPVRLDVFGPARLVGDELTFNGQGTVTVTATHPGDDNYLAAQDVSIQFNVSRNTAQIWFNAADLHQVYNNSPRSVGVNTTPAGKTFEVLYTYGGLEHTLAPTDAGTYPIRARIINDPAFAGEVDDTLIISKAPQVITFNQDLGGKQVGDEFDLEAVTDSGLPVTYTLSADSLATLSGVQNKTLRINGVGEIRITASQMGDANYEATTTPVKTFTVLPTPGTINVDFSTVTYDGQPHGVIVSTIPLGLETRTSYDDSETLPTGAGSYPVVVSFRDQNYSGSASGNFVIAKANQEITFNPDLNRQVGESFELIATDDSNSNSPITFSLISGPATLAGSSLTLNGAGDVVVRAEQAGDDNHNPAPSVERVFKVGKRLAIITLSDLSHTYDNTEKSVSFTTEPLGKAVSVVYTQNNSVAIPKNAGTYRAQATISDLEFAGSAEANLVILKAVQNAVFNPGLVKKVGDKEILSVSGAEGDVGFRILSGTANLNQGTKEITYTAPGQVKLRADVAVTINYESIFSEKDVTVSCEVDEVVVDGQCRPVVCEADAEVACPLIVNGTNSGFVEKCNADGTLLNTGTCTLSCNNGYTKIGNECRAQVCTPNVENACPVIENGQNNGFLSKCNANGTNLISGNCNLVCNSGFKDEGGLCVTDSLEIIETTHKVKNVISRGAEIEWETNFNGTTEIVYAPTATWENVSTRQKKVITNLSKVHKIILDNLRPGTEYTYKIISKDANGNSAFNDPTFTTPDEPHKINISTSGTGTGAVTLVPTGTSCGANCSEFSFGTTVTITATPNSGSTLASLTGCTATGSNSCSVITDQDRAISVSFGLTPVSGGGGGGGGGSGDAGVGTAFTGYAWSSNIGWISFNSANSGAGSGATYSVKYDSTTKLLSGHAWSSNIGWISFNSADLTGCPSGTCQAKIVNNVLTGWARALSGVGRVDGWDGWISLSGASPAYSVLSSAGKLSGYAWGSAVVGWISFAGGTTANNGWEVDLPGGAQNTASIDVYLSPSNQGKSPSTDKIFNFAFGATLPTSIKWDVQDTTGLTCRSITSSNVIPAGIAVPTSTDWRAAGSVSLPANLESGTYLFGGECGPADNLASDSVTLVIASVDPLVTETFSLSAAPASYRANFILSPSSPKNFNTTITIDRALDFTQAVDLSFGTAPAGITVSPSSFSFPSGAGTSDSVNVTISVSKTAPSGVNTLTLTGVTSGAGPISKTLSIPITVTKSSFSGEI